MLSSYLPLAALPILYSIRNSLPLAWTIRVFFTVFKEIVARTPSSHPLIPKPISCLLSDLFPPKYKQGVTTEAKPYQILSALPPRNACVFDLTTVSKHVATIDECDFNMHLSNSSYPKNFDFARLTYAHKILSRGLLEGVGKDKGWIGLAGLSFRFLKEIPIGASYDVEVRLFTWDEKWVYALGTYMTKSKKAGAEPTVHCIGMGKLCFKSGRKTIPPWFFWSICGFDPSSPTAKTGNWEKAEALRARLLKEDPSKNVAGLLGRFIPEGGSATSADGKAAVPEKNGDREEWMKKSYWNVEGWEEERKRRLEIVKEWTLLGDRSMEELLRA